MNNIKLKYILSTTTKAELVNAIKAANKEYISPAFIEYIVKYIEYQRDIVYNKDTK